MSHVLDLYDGTTTIHLADDGAHAVTDYVPRAPEIRMASSETPGIDGAEITSTSLGNVTESATVLFHADTLANVRIAIQSIEAMLQRAARYTTHRQGTPVYVQADHANTGTVYRSQILSGRVEIADAALIWQWARGFIEGKVIWTRKPYWETTQLNILAMTQTVYSHDDAGAGHNNYLDIAGSSILGSLPAPLYLLMSNPEASATATVWVASNTFANPATITHMLEGEMTTGLTSTADADSSGGAFGRVAWPATEGLIATWSASVWSKHYGQHYRVMARFGTNPTAGATVRLKLVADSVVLWQSQLIALTTGRLQELCTIQLPPTLIGLSAVYPIDLALYGSAASGNCDLDYLQILPTEGFRRLTPITGGNLAQYEELIDDGPNDFVYKNKTFDEVPAALPAYTGWGTRPMVWPGKACRLYFIASDGSTENVDRRLTVSVYYRPRRLTL
jgi:hypothetical protein